MLDQLRRMGPLRSAVRIDFHRPMITLDTGSASHPPSVTCSLMRVIFSSC